MTTETKAPQFRHLSHLFELMKAGDPSTLREDGTYRGDLPVFGPQHQDEGGTMDPAPGVWSWDWSRAISGTCPADLSVGGYRVDEDGVMTLVGHPTRGRHARPVLPTPECPKCKSSCCRCEIAWDH